MFIGNMTYFEFKVCLSLVLYISIVYNSEGAHLIIIYYFPNLMH